jgi:hypothetical protein
MSITSRHVHCVLHGQLGTPGMSKLLRVGTWLAPCHIAHLPTPLPMYIILCSPLTHRPPCLLADYELEAGATRNYEPWRDKEKAVVQAKADREEEERGNAMKVGRAASREGPRACAWPCPNSTAPCQRVQSCTAHAQGTTVWDAASTFFSCGGLASGQRSVQVRALVSIADHHVCWVPTHDPLVALPAFRLWRTARWTAGARWMCCRRWTR